MINKYKPHMLILPEDDANRQIANGFELTSTLNLNRFQILPVAGGWGGVRDSFEHAHNQAMKRFEHRLMLLLVDFDQQHDRRDQVFRNVSQHIEARVFILGAWSEPEDLRSDLGSFEQIGEKIGQSCLDECDEVWQHPLLSHNLPEFRRLAERVSPFLFSQ